MSEPDTEYETDAGPTLLPCPFCGSEDLRDSISHIDLTYLCAIRCRNCKTRAPTGEHVHQKQPLAKQQAYRSAVENWNRIAAAGTAAQEAREMGYDPVAAVKALPELLRACEDTEAGKPMYPRTAKDALASAEGSDNE